MLHSFLFILFVYTVDGTWEDIWTPSGLESVFIPSSVHRQLTTCLNDLEEIRQENQRLRKWIKQLMREFVGEKRVFMDNFPNINDTILSAKEEKQNPTSALSRKVSLRSHSAPPTFPNFHRFLNDSEHFQDISDETEHHEDPNTTIRYFDANPPLTPSSDQNSSRLWSCARSNSITITDEHIDHLLNDSRRSESEEEDVTVNIVSVPSLQTTGCKSIPKRDSQQINEIIQSAERRKKKKKKKIPPPKPKSDSEDDDQLLAEHRAKVLVPIQKSKQERTVTFYETEDKELMTEFESDLIQYHPMDLISTHFCPNVSTQHPLYPQYDRVVAHLGVHVPLIAVISDFVECFMLSHDHSTFIYEPSAMAKWVHNAIYLLSRCQQTVRYYPLFREYLILRNGTKLLPIEEQMVEIMDLFHTGSHSKEVINIEMISRIFTKSKVLQIATKLYRWIMELLLKDQMNDMVNRRRHVRGSASFSNAVLCGCSDITAFERGLRVDVRQYKQRIDGVLDSLLVFALKNKADINTSVVEGIENTVVLREHCFGSSATEF